MGKEIIRPIKGIDVDSAYNRRDDNTIYMAVNMRLNPIEETNLGEYTNIRGTNIAIEATDGSSLFKMTKVGDNIIIFAQKSGTDYILLVKESAIPTNGNSILELDLSDYYWNGAYHKVISASNNGFGFDSTSVIDVKTYYESDDVQKIYWTVENIAPLASQPMRVLNVIYSSKNNPSLFSKEDLEFTPSSNLSPIVLNKTISGSLLCGKIYYAYSLVNTIGLETSLSPLSKPFHLTTSLDTASNDFGYKGGGIDVNSNKGVNLSIASVDTSFNRLKLYSIHYIDDVSLPVVKLIYDNYVTSSFTYNDTGTSILSIAPEEFIRGYLLFTGGVSEIKNNRLFVSNYTEEYFDIDTDSLEGIYWDSRAYRFKSDQTALITNVDTSDPLTILHGNAGTYTAVPIDHDCVNSSNARDVSPVYIYQSDGATVGATGLNVLISQNYSLSVHPDIANSNIVSYAVNIGTYYSPNQGYSSYASPLNASGYKSFKPEEVYRLGIQFKNSKGKLSYPKWICDYRYTYDDNNIMSLVNTASLEMVIQALNISVYNIPTDPDTNSAYPYRIVYVPLTNSDEGVHWGMFTQLYNVTTAGLDITGKFVVEFLRNNDSTSEGAPALTLSDLGKYLEFVSPDYCFGNKMSYSNFKIFKYSAPVDIITTKPNTSSNYSLLRTKEIALNKVYNLSSTNIFYPVNGQYDVEYDSDIESLINLNGADVFTRIGVGRRYSGTSTCIRGGANKGRCQILMPSVALNLAPRQVMWGCSYVDDFLSKYGGITYEARQGNGYVGLTDFTTDANTITYGDCYLGSFEYLRQISENDSAWVKEDWETRASIPDVVYFPSISRINVNLRSDIPYSQIYKQDGSYLIHEYSGVQQDTSDYNGADWILSQETDLYLYNQAYSREQDLLMYYPKQALSSTQQEFKLRINASDKKIIGELTDSFTKISSNNYIDVDGQYGDIVALKTFNDKLFFFQKNAIGIVSTNERALTSIQDGSQLSMGVVNLLERYDYLTVKNGINNKNHLNISNSSIYVIDDVRKQLLKIDSGIEKISITKNVDSFVRVKDWTNGRVVYNRKYNEILFFYEESTGLGTASALVYSEITQQFSGIYTYENLTFDAIEVNRVDLYDELVLNDQNQLVTLNDGNFNEFSGQYAPSQITFLFSSTDENQLLYNVLEFIAYQQDVNGALVDFIDTIRIYTKTQDTGDLNFGNNSAFKFNKYRTNKIRNLSDRKRMLSDHLYVTIKTKSNFYYAPQNYRIFVRDMIATFSEYNYFG